MIKNVYILQFTFECYSGTEADLYAWQEDFWDASLPILHGERQFQRETEKSISSDCGCKSGAAQSNDACCQGEEAPKTTCCKEKKQEIGPQGDEDDDDVCAF